MDRHRVRVLLAWQAGRQAAVPQAGEPALCVRHVLAPRALDRATARVAADQARGGGRISALITDLAEVFRKGTWAYRHERPGAEAAAWRRAAAALDGSVLGGCPPGSGPG